MSFELHDYPGMPSVCAICKHDDCSKPGEMWIHLVTVEDRPAIGMNCVRLIADNVGLTKETVVLHEVRPPTGNEIGEFLLSHYGLEVVRRDPNDSNPSTSADSTGSVARQRANRTSQRAQRTD